jgi:hypothetical protein
VQFQLSSGGFQLSAVGVPGKTYDLFTSTNLVSPTNWLFFTSQPADVNGFLEFTNLAASAPEAFYRLQASEP